MYRILTQKHNSPVMMMRNNKLNGVSKSDFQSRISPSKNILPEHLLDNSIPKHDTPPLHSTCTAAKLSNTNCTYQNKTKNKNNNLTPNINQLIPNNTAADDDLLSLVNIPDNYGVRTYVYSCFPSTRKSFHTYSMGCTNQMNHNQHSPHTGLQSSQYLNVNNSIYNMYGVSQCQTKNMNNIHSHVQQKHTPILKGMTFNTTTTTLNISPIAKPEPISTGTVMRNDEGTQQIKRKSEQKSNIKLKSSATRKRLPRTTSNSKQISKLKTKKSNLNKPASYTKLNIKRTKKNDMKISIRHSSTKQSKKTSTEPFGRITSRKKASKTRSLRR